MNPACIALVKCSHHLFLILYYIIWVANILRTSFFRANDAAHFSLLRVRICTTKLSQNPGKSGKHLQVDVHATKVCRIHMKQLTVSAVHLGMYMKRERPNSWLFSLIGRGVAAHSLYQVWKGYFIARGCDRHHFVWIRWWEDKVTWHVWIWFITTWSPGWVTKDWIRRITSGLDHSLISANTHYADGRDKTQISTRFVGACYHAPNMFGTVDMEKVSWWN